MIVLNVPYAWQANVPMSRNGLAEAEIDAIGMPRPVVGLSLNALSFARLPLRRQQVNQRFQPALHTGKTLFWVHSATSLESDQAVHGRKQ